MRYPLVAPIALLAGSCVTARPPSADFFARAEEVPSPHQLLLPSGQRAFSAWQLPADDPWARYNKWTLLASLGDQAALGQLPDVQQLQIVRRAERIGALLGAGGLPEGTLWVVDLRGAAAVAFGNALSHAAPHPVSLVLTFNNWPASRELVPAEETLAALVTLRPRLPDAGLSGSRPVFLLDAWRLAYREDAADEEVIDNRYYLNPNDLPDAATLQAHGIRQVVYLTETLGGSSDTIVEEDDLNEPFARYAQAGISIAMLGLSDLDQQPDFVASGSASTLRTLRIARYYRVYVPRVRHTVLLSPLFYARSHGGFGGPRARPHYHGIFHHGSRPGHRTGHTGGFHSSGGHRGGGGHGG